MHKQMLDNDKNAFANRKTRITASVMGTLLGLAGIFNHGIFEILQGFTPTGGYFIEAIGEEHRFWVHGTEAALTCITFICAFAGDIQVRTKITS